MIGEVKVKLNVDASGMAPLLLEIAHVASSWSSERRAAFQAEWCRLTENGCEVAEFTRDGLKLTAAPSEDLLLFCKRHGINV